MIDSCSKPMLLSETYAHLDALLAALMVVDQDSIRHLAFDVIAELSSEALDSLQDGSAGEPSHRLRMEVFYASMLTWGVEKSPEVETQVEDDIDLWIEANAPALVAANVEQVLALWSAVGGHGDWPQRLDYRSLAGQQQQALQATWAMIEAWIEQLVGGGLS